MNTFCYLLTAALAGFCSASVLPLLVLSVMFGVYCVYSINDCSAKKYFFVSYFCFVFTSLSLFFAVLYAFKDSREHGYPPAEECIDYDGHQYVHSSDCPCHDFRDHK